MLWQRSCLPVPVPVPVRVRVRVSAHACVCARTCSVAHLSVYRQIKWAYIPNARLWVSDVSTDDSIRFSNNIFVRRWPSCFIAFLWTWIPLVTVFRNLTDVLSAVRVYRHVGLQVSHVARTDRPAGMQCAKYGWAFVVKNWKRNYMFMRYRYLARYFPQVVFFFRVDWLNYYFDRFCNLFGVPAYGKALAVACGRP